MSPDRGPASFGSKLRDARERRGISLRQIASATKISVAALEALERDDISRLPGGIFSRAFVRSYAVEVGLDPETTIHEFIAQFPNDAAVTAGHPTSDQVEDHEAVESERQTAGTFLWLAVISVPLAIALIYFTSAGRSQSGAESKPPEAGEAPHAALPPPVETAPTPPPATPSSETGAPPAGQSPDAPRADAAPKTPPAATPASAADAAAPPAAGGQPDASSAAANVPADRLTIELTAKRPCWVSATVDGQKSIERLLQPGERQTIDVRREMVLTAGDAAALALTFNGAEGRPLGKTGEVVTARINLTNFKNYLQAR